MTEIAGFDTRLVFTALVGLVAVQRLFELRLSARNTAWLRERGGIEAGAEHYPRMVLLHVAFLIAAPLEVWFLGREFHPIAGRIFMTVFLIATGLRYWTIMTLGRHWTTRVICLPGSNVVTSGPFRLLRHPNYVAVYLEIVSLPMVHHALATAVIFAWLDALLMRVRVEAEENLLKEHTDYAERFGITESEEDTE